MTQVVRSDDAGTPLSRCAGEGGLVVAMTQVVRSDDAGTPLAREAGEGPGERGPPGAYDAATATGIFPIFACHSRGPVSWTEVPVESTATVTGMSLTSNS